MKKPSLYEWSVILSFIIVPLTAIGVEILIVDSSPRLAVVALKWFVFCGIGLRLGMAGIKQIITPQFTAKEIFKIQNDGILPIVRELGFANVCFSVIALISLFIPTFRIPSAIAGGLYFGLAGLLHITKQKDSENEIFALVSDIFIFLIIGILSIINVIQH